MPTRLSRSFPMAIAGGLFDSIRSDTAGGFRFDTVVPGAYLVFAWESIPDGAIENEPFRLPYEPRAERIYVDR
jgi:hypothetical protein